MKFCPACGMELVHSWAFCQSCGKQLAISAEATGTAGDNVVPLPPVETASTEWPIRPTQLEPAPAPPASESTPRFSWKFALIGFAILIGLAFASIAAMNDIGTHQRLGANRAQLALARASFKDQAQRLQTTQANFASTQVSLSRSTKALHSAKRKIRALSHRLSSANQATAQANAAAKAANTNASMYQGAAETAYTSGYQEGYYEGWYGYPYLP